MSWAICPAADLVTQPYACVHNVPRMEWTVDASVCDTKEFHAGIDLGSSGGGWSIFRAPVYATRAGTVAAIGVQYLGPFAVVLQVSEGGRTVYIEYGHLDAPSVTVGQQVNPGDQIGFLGTQGSSTAPHLHVEVRIDGPRQGFPDRYTIDPTPYLNLGGDTLSSAEFNQLQGELQGHDGAIRDLQTREATAEGSLTAHDGAIRDLQARLVKLEATAPATTVPPHKHTVTGQAQ